jgi:hypothetical protein
MMRVYLAAPYAARDHLRPLAEELRSLGFATTSSWIGEQQDINAGTVGAAVAQTQAEVEAHVVQDFSDLNRTDVVVAFTAVTCARLCGGDWLPSFNTGGRHVDIGAPENVFHRGACRCVPDWHAAVLALVELRERTTERRSLVEAEVRHG